MTQHTPGPWNIQARNSVKYKIWQPPAGLPIIVAECGHHVAELVWNGNNDGERGIANARLIAAAPELYARLADLERAAQAHLDSTDGSEREYLRDECFKARAAIAKAEGSATP